MKKKVKKGIKKLEKTDSKKIDIKNKKSVSKNKKTSKTLNNDTSLKTTKDNKKRSNNSKFNNKKTNNTKDNKKISNKKIKSTSNNNKLKNDKKSKLKISIIVFIIIILILLILQFSFSIFSYDILTPNTNVIAGDLYLNYINGDTVNLNNILPSDTYNENNYFEFSVSGKNTNNKDILYEIVLERGENINDKIRLEDRFLKFRLVEVKNGEEVEIFADKSFLSIENTVIHVDSVSKNTIQEIEKKYRLYIYVNGVLIGNTKHSNYTTLEWENIYANVNIKVRSDNSSNTYIINYNPNRLSSEYQEVEYIESFGNEVIKTDIIPKDNMGIYMKVVNQYTSSNTTFLGSSNKSSNSIYSIGNTTNNISYGWNQTTKIENSTSDILNIIELNFLNDKKVKVDSKVINSLNTTELTNTNITIFALNENNNITNYSSVKLYELKISIDDVIKYDFIPCYRILDNVVGLYDIINDKFYQSETGSLSIGEERKIKQFVNYESSVSLLDNSFSNNLAFYEWNTKPDGSGVSYKRDEIVEKFANKGEVVDLYAIWSNKLVIDNVKISRVNNASVTINSTDKLSLNTLVELANDTVDSEVLLSITLKNNSSYRYAYSGLNYLNYDNQDIGFDIFGLQKNDIIESGESLTFRILFKYVNDVINNNVLNSTLSLVFKNLSGMKLSDLVLLNNQNQIDGADGLYKYNDKYYFSGSNVNNYIWFNCDDGYESGESKCEKWRIISVENDGSIKIIRDDVLDIESIQELETKTNFWKENIPNWMISPKILTVGKVLFDVKERRPSNINLENSYCIRTSNGCNAYSKDLNNTGLYKGLSVDLDSLVKKYLEEVYIPHALKENNLEKIKEYVANIGLVEPSISLENVIKSEKSITTKLKAGLLNLSDYIYANKDTSCWYEFSKCNNNVNNNWLTLPDNPYYLQNGKIVETSTQSDKNAQVWTVESKGLVSRDANNEYYLRPVVILKNDIEALGTGIEGDYYIIVS